MNLIIQISRQNTDNIHRAPLFKQITGENTATRSGSMKISTNKDAISQLIMCASNKLVNYKIISSSHWGKGP